MKKKAVVKPRYDTDLLADLKNRNINSQLYVREKEAKSLGYLAFRILHSVSEAEILVSDVFSDFFFHYVDTLVKPAAIKSYLRLMVIRRANRKTQESRKLCSLEIDDYDFACKDSDLSQEIDNRIWLMCLNECLAKLPMRSRSVIRLYYTHGLTFAEVGELLGISRQGVHKTIKHCHKTLRRCLEIRRKEWVLAKKYKLAAQCGS